jgi:hypothetical protein
MRQSGSSNVAVMLLKQQLRSNNVNLTRRSRARADRCSLRDLTCCKASQEHQPESDRSQTT